MSQLNEEDRHMLEVLTQKSKQAYLLHEKLHALLKDILDQDSVTEFFETDFDVAGLREGVKQYRLNCWNIYTECEDAIKKLNNPNEHP